MALKKIAILLIILSTVAVGCNTTGCLENGSAIPLAGFYSADTEQQISLSAIAIHGVDSPDNANLLSAGSVASQVYLPMRSAFSSTQWCISYSQPGLDDDAFNDTISFQYDSMPFFASEECGAMYKYIITEIKYTRHLVDSVAVVDSVITNVDKERIKIFFRTATNSEEEGSE